MRYTIDADTPTLKGKLGIDSKESALKVISGIMEQFDIDSDEVNF
jgi:hypothetical protein